MEEEKKEVEIKESDLDALYFYVEMNFDSMDEEEKTFWLEILQKIDKDFYAD